jgi:hypothetical protein
MSPIATQPTPQQQQEYAQFMVYESLLKQLSTAKIKAKEQRIYDIAYENQQILQCNTPTFIFQGQRYATKGWERVPNENRSLASELHKEMYDLCKPDDFEAMETLAFIRQYLRNILQTFTSLRTLKRLLPSCLHIALPTDPVYLGTPVEPTEHELLAFQQKHSEHIAALKKYLAFTLIYYG